MATIEALKEEIGNLSTTELSELREWLAECHGEDCDSQTEVDAASGNLDKFLDKSVVDHGTGPSNEPNKRSVEAAILALYSENGSVARAMMEWRHRVITLYVLTLGGVSSSVLWMYQNNALRRLPLPFFLAAVVMCALALMDNTNSRILKACYRVGDRIERRIAGTSGAIYSAFYERSRSKRTVTYTRLLRILFVGSAGAFVSAAVFFLWRY